MQFMHMLNTCQSVITLNVFGGSVNRFSVGYNRILKSFFAFALAVSSGSKAVTFQPFFFMTVANAPVPAPISSKFPLMLIFFN